MDKYWQICLFMLNVEIIVDYWFLIMFIVYGDTKATNAGGQDGSVSGICMLIVEIRLDYWLFI